jgi:hypothetical protein
MLKTALFFQTAHCIVKLLFYSQCPSCIREHGKVPSLVSSFSSIRSCEDKEMGFKLSLDVCSVGKEKLSLGLMEILYAEMSGNTIEFGPSSSFELT